MHRFLVGVLASVALVHLGLGGCSAYQFQVVQPPGTESLDQAVVVIVDTHSGHKAVVPYPLFVSTDLRQFASLDELNAYVEKQGAAQRR